MNRVRDMSSSQSHKLSRHLLRQAVEVLPAAVLVVDAHGRDRLVLFANAAAARLCGLATTELVGRPASSFLADSPDQGAEAPWRLKSPSGALIELTASPLYASPGIPACWLLTPGGTVADLPATGAARPDPATARLLEPGPAREAADGGSGRLPAAGRSFDPGATGTFSVTDSWIRMRDERNDPATGVLCRESFLDTLSRDLAVANRSGRAVSVMHFRVEGMESYQGLFGRHATDACLRKVAHSISTNLRRGSDCCGRTSHDTFTVLSHGGEPEVTAEFAARIAQRVRDLAIHHPRSGNGRYVTVSWGLVVTDGRRLQDDAEVMAAAEADLERRAAQALEKPAEKSSDRGSAAGST